MGEILWGFLYTRREVSRCKETEAALFLPRLSKADGREFCEEHEKLENKRYEKYDRDRTQNAGTDVLEAHP